MDRLLDAITNPTRVAIIDTLLAADTPMTALELRHALDVPAAARADFGRQINKLHDVGVLERADDAYVLAERQKLEQFLQAAADVEAALDARRATRSSEAAHAR